MKKTHIFAKSYAYIVYNHKLLIFEHTAYPEAGIQVPGGSVEVGEKPDEAALREAKEETGLLNLVLVRKLGIVQRDLSDFGLEGVQERHYYQLAIEGIPEREWISYERTPSDGSPGPIEFRFFWADLDQVPHLSGGLDEMLSQLYDRID